MISIKKLDCRIPIAEIFELFHEEEDTVILESSLVNSPGQFSIIGRKPYLKIEKKGNGVLINGKRAWVDFETYVKKYFTENHQENKSSLPLISGAIGYFAYDDNKEKEGEDGLAESILIFYDQFIMEAHDKNEIYVVANGKTNQADILIQEVELKIGQARRRQNSGPRPPRTEIFETKYDFNKEEYLQAIHKMMDYIVEGDIYIANMTQRIFLESDRKPYDLYVTLRRENPAPYAAYLNYNEFQVVCASPERFIRVKDQTIITKPIKGTRKRGCTPGEDRIMRMELEHSEKDKSELLMIVDLERNDLNKICEPGSVTVNHLFDIESYATVHHLVATVSGHLKPETDIIDITRAVFPGGSITGAPKKRAMEIIEELEHTKRGLYTGSIGYFSLNGDCDMNIVIRTAIYQNGIYQLGVGGGITFESDAAMEYEETLLKAKAFVNALRPAKENDSSMGFMQGRNCYDRD